MEPPPTDHPACRDRDSGGMLTWIGALFSGGKSPGDAPADAPAGSDCSGGDSGGGDGGGGGD